MTRSQIYELLPHREAMLLLDEVEAAADGSAKGRYTIRGDEWFLQGHFPGNPVVPGVIQCEMMAQTCCVLVGDHGKTPLFSGIERVRFKKPVHPGDTLEFECRLEKVKGPFYFAKGQGSVDGNLCVAGEFSFALVDANRGKALAAR